jgi:hypothetical protein
VHRHRLLVPNHSPARPFLVALVVSPPCMRTDAANGARGGPTGPKRGGPTAYTAPRGRRSRRATGTLPAATGPLPRQGRHRAPPAPLVPCIRSPPGGAWRGNEDDYHAAVVAAPPEAPQADHPGGFRHCTAAITRWLHRARVRSTISNPYALMPVCDDYALHAFR